MIDRTWGRPPEVEAVYAILSLLLFSAIAWAVLFHKVPAENEKYAMLMLGALIGLVKDASGRYFQATKGSQEQRQDNARLTDTLAAVVATAAPAPTDPTAQESKP